MIQELKEEFIEALKKKPFTLRNCSLCEFPLQYWVQDEKLLWQGNCNCTTYSTPPEERDFDSLDFYLTQEDFASKIKEFIAKAKIT